VGVVEQHPHFKRALTEDGLDYADVLPVLKAGAIYEQPEFDSRFQEWRYKIEGRTAEGAWLKIVFAFIGQDETLLITAFVTKR
jgi:uncharacterized DUF497 family protein